MGDFRENLKEFALDFKYASKVKRKEPFEGSFLV
jgi:hypothetical protein